MRQIFSSPRLENVEGVAKLLNEHGIETWISEGRSYKGQRRQAFSYRERHDAVQPGVWIVKAEDQTRARQLLRDAGLIDSTRTDSFIPASLQAAAPRTTREALVLRLKLLLLAAIVGGALLVGLRLFG